MRVIICGAGKVGYNIAESMAREGNNVTVIDNDARLVAQINDEIDARGVVGHASSPDILKQAGAENADMIIAVTASDEVNMVACQIGHSLFNIPRKMARIRRQDYCQPEWSNLFSRSHLPIDVIISPELVIAQNIYQRLLIPGSTYAAEMADGNAFLIGVICKENCPVLNTVFSQIPDLFPDLRFSIVGVERNGEVILPCAEEQIYIGDECFFVVDAAHLQRVMSIFGHEEKEARNLIVAGGGYIGMALVRLLKERTPNLNVKIIEKNEARASYISDKLNGVVVLQGSALDSDLLEEASIQTAETFVAVTNDDENNILSSLLAKRNGCKRTITLVNNETYSTLLDPLGIDSLILPGSTVVAKLMQHVRKGRVRGLYNLHDGFMQVTEAEVSDSAMIANQMVKELELPEGVMIVGFMKDGEFHSAHPDDYIKPDDHVVALGTRKNISFVEQMFSVKVDLF